MSLVRGAGWGTIELMRGVGAFRRVAREIRQDVRAAQLRDPAARGLARVEILLTYGGVHALLAHRVAHVLHEAGVPLIPHAIAYLAKLMTGLESHPRARLREGPFIVHGEGGGAG